MPATDLRLNRHFIKVQEHIFSISVSVDSLELQAGIMHLEQMSMKHLEKHLQPEMIPSGMARFHQRVVESPGCYQYSPRRRRL